MVEQSTKERWHIFTHCTFIPILHPTFIHWDDNGWNVGTAKVEPLHKQRDSQCSPPVGSRGYTMVPVHVSLRLDYSTGQWRSDSHFPISYCTCTCVYLYLTIHELPVLVHRCRKSLLGPLVFSTHAATHRSFSFLHFPNILPNRQPITPLRSGIITLK